MAFTTCNHYVPQWYQRRFQPDGLKENKFFYLDLTPEKVIHPDNRYHFREECRRLGTAKCFMQDHLYTLLFGEHATDVIEKRFFGKIDQIGADIIDALSDYDPCQLPENGIPNFVRYLDAQKLRTPKGLDYVRRISRSQSHFDVLHKMRELWQVHITIWMEGVWEILHCDNSETKFIITDHPITTYNKDLFPLTKECRYPFDAPIEYLGTHTLFPLNLNRCLVITNLGYVRNPWANLRKVRQNPRYFANTLFDIRKVQTGRQISETEVQAINYILKTRARRYIAAAQKMWLFPETYLKTTMWNKLGDRFFLMPDPRKVSFSTDIIVGFKDGSAWGIDEYGRQAKDNDRNVEKLRDEEWTTYQRAKQAWNQKFGPLLQEDMIRYF